MKKYTRREFIKRASFASLAVGAAPVFAGKLFAMKKQTTIAVVEGDSPFAITEKALAMLGGMKKFVSKGDVVVVKPNIGWDRTPEQAANTNPFVVGAIVKAAFDAGAKVVRVLDNTCNDARRCYVNSGIEAEAKKYGAQVLHVEDFRLRDMDIGGKVMKKWPVYRDFVECDAIINVPILKHHGLSGVTIGMKNWLGSVGGRRSVTHQNIDDSIVDLAKFFKPKLTVLDAYRILLRNGPQGGSLNDVEIKKTVAASEDPVAIDAFGAKLFGKDPSNFVFIKRGHSAGLGEMDLSKVNLLRATA